MPKDINANHCVNSKMALLVVSRGTVNNITAQIFCPKALEWSYQEYNPNSSEWEAFIVGAADSWVKHPDSLNKCQWFRELKERFPDIFAKIETLRNQLLQGKEAKNDQSNQESGKQA